MREAAFASVSNFGENAANNTQIVLGTEYSVSEILHSFFLELPMRQVQGMEIHRPSREGVFMRALVIDDSRSMRMYVASLIEEQGWQTDTACDGEDALRLLEQGGSFDVATVDWDMPVMDGHAFVTAVRKDPRFQQLKLLMLTARDGTEEVIKALEAGADDYLMKPVTSEMLQEKMRLIGLF